eukprot:gb/GECG01011612.1/.p1 GENE.gb/GECG01011612.1/~~gb/GECG01011612.1/.p1  ORF type:complete len:259 (+),score=42.27 gb/GECG01011612.1/:1-777(+)
MTMFRFLHNFGARKAAAATGAAIAWHWSSLRVIHADSSSPTASEGQPQGHRRRFMDSFESCEDPSCSTKGEMKQWLQRMQQHRQGTEEDRGHSRSQERQPSTASSASDSSSGVSDRKEETEGISEPEDCPLDRAELGNRTWSLLHSMAAYYPEEPTKTDQDSMKAFLQALGKFYPCKFCAAHFANELEEDPPDVSSRASLSLWLCEKHNVVNEMLEKPRFECRIEELDKRWKYGHQGCLANRIAAMESLGQDEGGEDA